MKKANIYFFEIAYIVSFIGLISISWAMLPPLLALLLEGQGVSGFLIGVTTTVQYCAGISVPFLIPRLISRMNPRKYLYLCLLLGVFALCLFVMTNNIFLWLVGRFIFGLAAACIFITCEAWINRLIDSEQRSRIFAVYGIAISVGLIIGPTILQLTNLNIWSSICVAIAILAIAAIPLSRVRSNTTKLLRNHPDTPKISRWKVIKKKPISMILGYISGGIEGSIYTFLPIWAVKNNYTRIYIIFKVASSYRG